MVAVPAEIPLIVPFETVAIFTSEVDQDPPETVEAKVVVDPTQTDCVPDKVPAEVAAVTVPVTGMV